MIPTSITPLWFEGFLRAVHARLKSRYTAPPGQIDKELAIIFAEGARRRAARRAVKKGRLSTWSASAGVPAPAVILALTMITMIQ